VALKDFTFLFNFRGSLNDINIFYRFHLFCRVASGDALACKYNVNGHDYIMGYYLTDSIYPSWSRFLKTILTPKTKKEAEFSKAQETCRKDIKRVFGILQARFAIVWGPARFWKKKPTTS
jgi:hypothetical protein